MPLFLFTVMWNESMHGCVSIILVCFLSMYPLLHQLTHWSCFSGSAWSTNKPAADCMLLNVSCGWLMCLLHMPLCNHCFVLQKCKIVVTKPAGWRETLLDLYCKASFNIWSYSQRRGCERNQVKMFNPGSNWHKIIYMKTEEAGVKKTLIIISLWGFFFFIMFCYTAHARPH